MRNTIFLLTQLFLLGVAVAKGGGQYALKPRHELRVEVDSVAFRPDVTRVYCRAMGRPNTSMRIDSVSVANARKPLMADDVDPIEFGRAFQWEEEGILPLEIDFAPLKRGKLVLKFFTPYGVTDVVAGAE